MPNKRILVADDEIYIVHILEFTLTMEGYDVISAGDGEEALRRVRADHPDLLVVDGRMPKLDGYEVVRQLRLDAATHDLPIILLTTKGHPTDPDHGYDDYIVKPFSPRRLLEKIQGLLARKS
jgi:DNA-binding response OmpR family regulator